MRSATTIRRLAVAAVAVLSLSLINAPSAFANWSSYIDSWTDGDESRRWADESYSQVLFTGCTQTYGSQDSVDVKMFEDVAFQFDPSYGSKHYTNCFNGSSYTSNGEWTGLPSGDFYFQADKVAEGGSCCLLFVDEVYVDTTQAD